MSQSALTAINPLDDLPPLAMPVEPGFWPPAPGWWILGLLAISMLLFFAFRITTYRKQRALKNTAIKRLKELNANRIKQPSSTSRMDNKEFINHTAKLLRQFTIQQYGAEIFASLTDKQWLYALDLLVNDTLMNTEAGELIIDRYKAQRDYSEEDIQTLYLASLKWLEHAPTSPALIDDRLSYVLARGDVK